MKNTAKKPTADEIADMAERGENISKFFANKGKMKQPLQRVNVDFTIEMLQELDAVASELNISRQAVIKSFLRQALDQHYLAKSKAGKKTTVRIIHQFQEDRFNAIVNFPSRPIGPG